MCLKELVPAMGRAGREVRGWLLPAILLAPGNVAAQDSPLDRALIEAGMHGNSAKVAELLRQGANPNAAGRQGVSALHAAALQGDLKSVELLLAAGANANAVDDQGETPLHKAVSGDRDLERVKALVGAGAKLNATNEEGVTPVRKAAMYGSKPIYEWLIEMNGGNEPKPVFEPTADERAKSPADLISTLISAKPQEQAGALRALVRRQDDVMPEVFRRIEAGTPIAHFYRLFELVGDPKAVPLIKQQLTKKEHAMGAFVALERIRPGTIEALPAATKREVADALAAVGEAEPGMITSFSNDMLAMLGPEAAGNLLKLMRHANPEHRRRAIGALDNARFSDDESTAAIIKRLSDENAEVRKEAARILGKFGEPSREVRDALLAILKNPPPYALPEKDEKQAKQFYAWKDLADTAGSSLGRFGPEIIDELLPMLTPLNEPYRLPAITALVSTGPAGVPRLIELCEHEDKAIAVSASVALNRMGAPAAPQVAAALAEAHDRKLEMLCSALWWMGPRAKGTISDLIKVVKDENRSDDERANAIWAATKVDRVNSREEGVIRSVLPALVRVLEKGSFRMQGRAAEAAGVIGPGAADALPALRKRLVLPGRDVGTEGYVRDYVLREAQKAIAAIERGM